MRAAFRLTIAAFGLAINVSTDVVQAQFAYSTNYNGTLNLIHYTGTNPVVTIPSSDGGFTVTSIGTGVFENSTLVTSVTIPNTVVRIHPYAFDFCTSLTNVTIGTGVTNFEDSVFTGCSKLPSVTIPNSVIGLGTYAFSGCSGLTNVTLGSGVTAIGDDAFSYCSSLTGIVIPNGVTSIGNSAFDTSALTSITIPKGVTSIGDRAFHACSKLTSVYFQGNAPSVGSDLFFRAGKVTVYYRAGTSGWDAFSSATGLTPVLWQPQTETQPSIASVGVQSNQFRFIINGTSSQVIVVEASTSLSGPVWSPVGTNTLTGGASDFSDSEWKNYPIRFYRLRSQ
jgi:hypothetical protein